jgi:hypothetical protein
LTLKNGTAKSTSFRDSKPLQLLAFLHRKTRFADTHSYSRIGKWKKSALFWHIKRAKCRYIAKPEKTHQNGEKHHAANHTIKRRLQTR